MFIKPAADPMPTLFQVGTITNIEKTTLTKKETYFMKKYTLEGEGAARMGKKDGFFLYLPSFFARGYNVNNEENRGTKNIFLSNILRPENKWTNFDPKPGKFNSQVGISFLQAASGSHENYVRIVDELQEVYASCSSDADFAEKLDEIFASFVGNQVGYILKQQYEDSEEVNEKGYPIPVAGKYYEISGFFYTDRDTEKKIRKAVEKYNDKPFPPGYRAIMCYDTEIPFSSVGATSN